MTVVTQHIRTRAAAHVIDIAALADAVAGPSDAPSDLALLARLVSQEIWIVDAGTCTVTFTNTAAAADIPASAAPGHRSLSEDFEPDLIRRLLDTADTLSPARASVVVPVPPTLSPRHGGRDLTLAATFASDGAIYQLMVVGSPRSVFHDPAIEDPMTGLANRDGFRTAVTRRLDASRTSEITGAVLVLDLDRFKLVNDLHGHATGDALVLAVAARIGKCVSDRCEVARLGGDEFAIVQHGICDDLEVRILANLLVDALGAPFTLGDVDLRIGVSIGVASYDASTRSFDDVFRKADLALRKSKLSGRGRFTVYTPALEDARRTRRTIEGEMRPALMRGEFEAFYQPQLDVASSEISGFECLARWNHPTLGWISPGEFIPVAEDLGLIERLGAQMLALACQSAARWPRPVTIAVNVSSLQLRNRGFVSAVFQTLVRAGLATDRLELEITESCLLDEDPMVIEVLNQLRVLGVRLSLDDFGTGYASLSYLRRLPLNKVKIDQSFVRDIVENAGSRAIVCAVSQLARDLGMSVTAEGVETQEQFDILAISGCTHVQGYLVGRPDPDPVARLTAGSASPIRRLVKWSDLADDTGVGP
jgi:diguanylate cyclase (GGDEF)-like protein